MTAVWVVLGGMVYGPDLGRGFVKDDFTWIRSAKSVVLKPARLAVPDEPGFFRPVVTATFVVDYLRNGLDAREYGWTNLTLYIACAIAVVLLAVSLGLSWPAAATAGFLWAVNPHGINMALIWLSGRTSLCLTLFSVLAAIAFLRRRYGVAAVLVCFALGSKEEAVLLPLILLAWLWLRERTITWQAAASVLLPLAVYSAVRLNTPAFTPDSAPVFYRFTFAPSHVARNAMEYIDRSTTLVAGACLIAAVISRKKPALDERATQILVMAGVWWIGMFAITMWLPVRSSLYAVCPSVASALAGAVLMEAMRSSPRSVVLELVIGSLVLAAIPLYRARNDPWVEGARVSARVLSAIESDLPRLPPAGTILLDDEVNSGSNFHNAFGDLLTEALQTMFDRPWTGRIDVPGGDVIAEYRLTRGRIDRIGLRQAVNPR